MIETECANCHTPLKSRKPSKSGRSYCNLLPCQAAKQRFFRQRWKDGQNVIRDSPDAKTYITRALHEERNPCPYCGLADAVGPYVHRDSRRPLKPCKGTGGVGWGQEWLILWMDVVHPSLAAQAQRDAVEANREAAELAAQAEKDAIKVSES